MVVLNSVPKARFAQLILRDPLGRNKPESSFGPVQAQQALYVGTAELVILWDWNNSCTSKPGGCWSRAVLLDDFAGG